MSNSWWLRKDIPFEYFSPVFADIDHTADKNCYTGSYHSCLLHHIEAWVEDARPASVFLHPGTNLQWKLNERQIATARLLFFCTRSSILILKFSSQKCFFCTMFENHFKKSLFCNSAKFIFGEKLNQINSLIKIRENIIVLQCLVVDNFDFTWKIVEIISLKKFVKRQQFYTGFSFWQLWFHEKNSQ